MKSKEEIQAEYERLHSVREEAYLKFRYENKVIEFAELLASIKSLEWVLENE